MKRFICLLLLTALVGCAQSDQPNISQRAMTSSTAKSVQLPRSEELYSLKQSAMAGSQDAALQLALWYMKFPTDGDTQYYWTQIAAENGSTVGQFNLAILLLSDETDPLNRARAQYWLIQAANKGSTLAKDQLAQMDQDKAP